MFVGVEADHDGAVVGEHLELVELDLNDEVAQLQGV